MIYAAAYGAKVAAGPGVVAVVKFLKPFSLPKRVLRNDIDALEEYLDQIKVGEDYESDYHMVAVEAIDRLGYSQAVSEATNFLVSKFQMQHHDYETVRLAKNNESFGHIGGSYLYAQDDESFFASSLAKYYQMWWMKYYFHCFYKQYGWDTNYGWPTREHQIVMLQEGPVLGVHRRSGLRQLAARWLDQCRNNSLWALCQPWLNTYPKWWKKAYPGYSFCHWLTNEQVAELRTMMSPVYDPEVSRWMSREILTLGLSPSEWHRFESRRHRPVKEVEDTPRPIYSPIETHI